MVDTGLMRKNEFKYILIKFLKINTNLILNLLTHQKFFLKKLKNVSDPEKKENNWKFIH